MNMIIKHVAYLCHILLLMIVFCSIIANIQTVNAQTVNYPQITTSAKQLLLIDLNTRTALVAKAANERMYPASMTKVMTAYLVFEHLKTGFIDMDSKFNVSYKAQQMGGSRMFLEYGTQVTVRDLLYGLIVQSGNDAAVVLAEGIAGSEDEFAKLMNSKAKELGMANSNFLNSSGWPDENHYVTAFDLAILAKHIIEDFPDFYPLYSERTFTYNNIKQNNRNPLLWQDLGVDGLKTGFTDASGYGLLASAKEGERRMIMVINGMESKRVRSRESNRVLRWAFTAWDNIRLYNAGQAIGRLPVALGATEMVTLHASQHIDLTVPARKSPQLKGYIEYKAPLIAPIAKGDVLGVLVVRENDKEILRSPVVAGQHIEETGFFGRLSYNIRNIF